MRQIPIGKISKWAGYPLFFFVCFVFFAYATFPYDRLADFLARQASARGYELEIIDLSSSGLLGLELEGVRVVMPTEGTDAPPLDVIIDELVVSMSLFSLFSSTKSFSFDAELAGGEAEGDVSIGENELEVDAEIEDVNLEALPALRSFTKVPLAGVLNGEVELSMPAEVAQSEGNVDVTIEGLFVGDGESKLEIPGWGGLTLDRADVGNLELLAVIEEGVAEIERAKSHGKDIQLDALGRLRLQRPLKRSELNVMVRAKVLDAYMERSTKVATMMELASSGLKSAQTADGALQYTIAGSVGGRLRPRPAGKQPFQAPK